MRRSKNKGGRKEVQELKEETEVKTEIGKGRGGRRRGRRGVGS